MTGFLLFVALARADEPATYERLFGEGSPPAETAAPEGSPLAPLKLAGPLALAGVAMFLAWRLRASGAGSAVGKPLQVISRHPLGDRAALVLVEVVDADGERRRLLVGTGGGAPSLVADLGLVPGPAAEPEPADVAGAAPVNVTEEILAERRAPSFAAHAARHGVIA